MRFPSCTLGPSAPAGPSPALLGPAGLRECGLFPPPSEGGRGEETALLLRRAGVYVSRRLSVLIKYGNSESVYVIFKKLYIC